MSKIKNGDVVTVHYTGRLEDGSVFDSSLNEGREPITVKLGEGTLIKGFEDGLIDMSIGDKKTVEIDPDNAYGYPNDTMVSEVPLSQVPEGVKVDHMLQAMTPSGPVNVRVIEVKEDVVVLDANHPLSGKKLIFDLEVVNVG
jgi:FKBP-type peptidyl-prolyl cis-trans isomerase SlpA